MTDRKTFSVGVLDGNHHYRREAENRIARVCFRKNSRRDLNKSKIYEFIWSQIALSSDEAVARFFGSAEF